MSTTTKIDLSLVPLEELFKEITSRLGVEVIVGMDSKAYQEYMETPEIEMELE